MGGKEGWSVTRTSWGEAGVAFLMKQLRSERRRSTGCECYRKYHYCDITQPSFDYNHVISFCFVINNKLEEDDGLTYFAV